MVNTRRDEILYHSARLFSQIGVASTTVRNIAEAVGMRSGSLYHYFPSKDAMAYEIVIRFIDDLNFQYAKIVAGESDCRTRLGCMVSSSVQVAIEHPYATEIYQNEGLPSSQVERNRMQVAINDANFAWEQIVRSGVESGEFRADIDADQFHRTLRESVWTMVRINRADLEGRATELCANTVSIFLDGFATRHV